MDVTVLADELAPVLRELVDSVVAPVVAQLDAAKKELADARAELAAIKASPPKDGAPGKDGRDGIDGKDGAPGRDGVDGVPGAVGERGLSGVDGVPGRDGKDGAQGRDGVPGAVGERGLTGADGGPGRDGKDGVGLAGALLDHDGGLVLTMSNGEVKSLGIVKGRDGQDGAPGKDGVPGRDADPEAMQAAVVAEVQKQVVAPLATAYKGVWKPGGYKCGDAVTWAGSLFIAHADTDAKPESTDDWKLAVKRGRDGKDGEAPKLPATVKLK